LRGIGLLIGNASMISLRCIGLLCRVRRHPRATRIGIGNQT
jgi:hypothetical protein